MRVAKIESLTRYSSFYWKSAICCYFHDSSCKLQSFRPMPLMLNMKSLQSEKWALIILISYFSSLKLDIAEAFHELRTKTFF